jgi:DNA-binding response OmpR family regulator
MLELDPVGFAVRVNGQDISLTYAEFLLLSEFVRHPYQVLGRDRLAALVRESVGARMRVKASCRSVDTHIARLRGKLRRKGCDCIKTMRFVGYRLVPPAPGDQETDRPARKGGERNIPSRTPAD